MNACFDLTRKGCLPLQPSPAITECKVDAEQRSQIADHCALHSHSHTTSSTFESIQSRSPGKQAQFNIKSIDDGQPVLLSSVDFVFVNIELINTVSITIPTHTKLTIKMFHHLATILAVFLVCTAVASSIPISDDYIEETAAAQEAEWKNVLVQMTKSNPCGSTENFTLCSSCGQLTNNQMAFYNCCINFEDFYSFCKEYVNHRIDRS